jgi:hypothetical protein
VDFDYILHFKYEGDDVLTVKVFDVTLCRTRTTKILTMKATTT